MPADDNHYSVVLEPNDEGWFHGACFCGADLGMFPTAEDACDALMDHAYAAGIASATGSGAQAAPPEKP